LSAKLIALSLSDPLGWWVHRSNLATESQPCEFRPPK
jgi:hypothetical protein